MTCGNEKEGKCLIYKEIARLEDFEADDDRCLCHGNIDMCCYGTDLSKPAPKTMKEIQAAFHVT
jgi:hypothetical protein